MTPHDAILVRLLADHDAARLSVRNWHKKHGPNRFNALATLASKGVPYRVNNAGDEAGRKAGERDLVELAERGLFALTRDRTKFPHCKLTPKGDATARALCGLPDRKIGRLILSAVAMKTEPDPKTLADAWLPEVALNGGRGRDDASPADRRELSLIEQDFLPAAAAGWLVAHSDVDGRTYYAVAPAGWDEFASPTRAPRFGKLPKPDRAAARLYREWQDRRLAAFQTDASDRPGEIGFVRLPVSFGNTAHNPETVAMLAGNFSGIREPGEDTEAAAAGEAGK